MPRLPDTLVDAVVYVYPDADSARRDELGGTGFLVGITITGDSVTTYCYVVTNRHIVVGRPEPVIKINLIHGGRDEIAVPQYLWHYHPDQDDVALASVGLSTQQHRLSAVLESDFCTRQVAETENVGIGDDAYFLGRFRPLGGTESRDDRNLPTLRFGNVSGGPVRIRQSDTGVLQESYLVEARSLSGYSGSPVFVSPTHRSRYMSGQPIPLSPHSQSYLLGIDWGHLEDEWRVRESDGTLHGEGWFVRANSGMMCVVPAWKVEEVLNLPDVVREREDELNRWRESVGIDPVHET